MLKHEGEWTVSVPTLKELQVWEGGRECRQPGIYHTDNI